MGSDRESSMGQATQPLSDLSESPRSSCTSAETSPQSSRAASGRPADTGSLLTTIEMGRRSIEMATKLAQYLAQGQAAENIEPVSFRRVAQLRLLPWGASSMWRAARIYQLAQKHPELYSYKHLRVAHISPIICLKGPIRIAVLRRAERRRWSRRRVEARVKAILASQEAAVVASGPHSLSDYLVELTLAERQAALALTESGPLPTARAGLLAQKPLRISTFPTRSQQSSFS